MSSLRTRPASAPPSARVAEAPPDRPRATAPIPSPPPLAPVPPPPAAAEAPAKPRRKVSPFAIAGLVLLAMVGFGVRQWLWGRHHVKTENAQVEGHIIPVLPKVGGYVDEVRVVENQSVRAGELLVLLDDRDYREKLTQADADLATPPATPGSGGSRG